MAGSRVRFSLGVWPVYMLGVFLATPLGIYAVDRMCISIAWPWVWLCQELDQPNPTACRRRRGLLALGPPGAEATWARKRVRGRAGWWG